MPTGNPGIPKPTSGNKNPVKRKPRLTDKMFRVVTEYFNNGFNKRKALIAAGYAETTARLNPGCVFNRPQVQAEIKRRQEKHAAASDLDREWIINRLMALAMAGETLAKYKKVQLDGSLAWDFTGATEEELKLINGLSVDFYTEGRGSLAKEIKKFKIDIIDPLSVLNSLARIEGLFNDRLKLEGDEGVIEALQAGRNRIKSQTD